MVADSSTMSVARRGVDSLTMSVGGSRVNSRKTFVAGGGADSGTMFLAGKEVDSGATFADAGGVGSGIVFVGGGGRSSTTFTDPRRANSLVTFGGHGLLSGRAVSTRIMSCSERTSWADRSANLGRCSG